MSKIKIEKNIPVPRDPETKSTKYPWRTMKVGDSFWINKSPSKMRHAANLFCRRNNIKYKWAARREKDGARIWRVK